MYFGQSLGAAPPTAPRYLNGDYHAMHAPSSLHWAILFFCVFLYNGGKNKTGLQPVSRPVEQVVGLGFLPREGVIIEWPL